MRTALAALTALMTVGLSMAAAHAAPAGDLQDVLTQLSWTSLQAEIEFTVERTGKSSLERKMTVLVEDAADGQKMLAYFTSPANMRGTAFLARTHADGDDEYFLYLRTLRRVKRVPSGSDNFMLRDFLSLYFMKPRPELWDYRKEGGGSPRAEDGLVTVLASPRSEASVDLTGYSAIRHFVDPTRRVIVRTDFLDSAGKAIRRQRVESFTEQDGVTVATRFHTEDLVEGASATVTIRHLSLNQRLPDDTFTTRHLHRL